MRPARIGRRGAGLQPRIHGDAPDRQNRSRMPFIMTAEAAAERVARGMARGQFEIAFPFFMTAVLKLLAAMPRPICFALLALVAGKRGKTL